MTAHVRVYLAGNAFALEDYAEISGDNYLSEIGAFIWANGYDEPNEYRIEINFSEDS